MSIINVSDIVDPKTGKTIKQTNAEMNHAFPVGSLVEDIETGVRLFVVKHGRDCDMTPLYYMSFDRNTIVEKKIHDHPAQTPMEAFLRGHEEGYNHGRITGGWPEASLKLIRLPS